MKTKQATHGSSIEMALPDQKRLMLDEFKVRAKQLENEIFKLSTKTESSVSVPQQDSMKEARGKSTKVIKGSKGATN